MDQADGTELAQVVNSEARQGDTAWKCDPDIAQPAVAHIAPGQDQLRGAGDQGAERGQRMGCHDEARQV